MWVNLSQLSDSEACAHPAELVFGEKRKERVAPSPESKIKGRISAM